MITKKFKHVDWILYAVIFLLSILSIILLYSLTYNSLDKSILYYQIIFIIASIIIMVFIQFVDYRHLRSMSWVFYIIGIAGLMSVILFGKSTFGANRWIDIGFFKLQPSEFFKIFIIISLSAYLSRKEILKLRELIFSIIIIAIPIVLVMLQPDMGTAIIIGVTSIAILIASGLKRFHLFSIGSLIIILAPLLWLFGLKPYQRERIVSFLNPQADPFGSGYHVLQSITAFNELAI